MTNRAWAWLAASTLAAAVFAGCGEARSRPPPREGRAPSRRPARPATVGRTTAPGRRPRTRRGVLRRPRSRSAHTRPTRRAAPLAARHRLRRLPREDGPARLARPTWTGTTQIDWGGVATARGASPAWDRATATCSNVYCHGVTLTGGTSTAPRWTTVDGSQATCGACHGIPPANHPELAAGFTLATCNACHPETVRSDGSIDAGGGRHVNGVG